MTEVASVCYTTASCRAHDTKRERRRGARHDAVVRNADRRWRARATFVLKRLFVFILKLLEKVLLFLVSRWIVHQWFE